MLLKRKDDDFNFHRGIYNAVMITAFALGIILLAVNLYRYLRPEPVEDVVVYVDPTAGELARERCLVLIEGPSGEPRYRAGTGEDCPPGEEQ